MPKLRDTPVDEQSSKTSNPRRFPAREIIAVSILLVLSLLVVHHRMIFSGFATVEGGGDSMLCNYTLEHEWKWISGQHSDSILWSPPIFFPHKGAAAYMDLLLGVLPMYAPWRMAGADPQTAFQLWMLSLSALNCLASYALLRYLFHTSVAASFAGTILFAFGSPRLMQIGHPQLWSGFYMIAVFAGLYLLFSGPPAALSRRRLYGGLALSFGGTVAQLYSGFYYTWFMAFCALPLLLLTLCVHAWRTRLIDFLGRHWRAVTLSLGCALLVLSPAVLLYRGALKEVGPRPYDNVRSYLPHPASWLAQGPDHWLYGPLNRWVGIGPNFGGQEMFDGIGPVTTVLVLAAFFHFRRRVPILIWAVVIAVILISSFPFMGKSLWWLVYEGYPGAQAIRVVSRFALFLLLPAAMAVALSIDWIATRISPLVALACVLAVFAEQAGSVNSTATYPKALLQGPVDDLVHELHPDCKSVLVSFPRGTTSVPIMHLLGMWAGAASGLPSLNGYSGQVPAGWPLGDVSIADDQDRKRLTSAIKTWMRLNPGEIENVCWIAPGASSAILIDRRDAENEEHAP